MRIYATIVLVVVSLVAVLMVSVAFTAVRLKLRGAQVTSLKRPLFALRDMEIEESLALLFVLGLFCFCILLGWPE